MFRSYYTRLWFNVVSVLGLQKFYCLSIHYTLIVSTLEKRVMHTRSSERGVSNFCIIRKNAQIAYNVDKNTLSDSSVTVLPIVFAPHWKGKGGMYPYFNEWGFWRCHLTCLVIGQHFNVEIYCYSQLVSDCYSYICSQLTNSLLGRMNNEYKPGIAVVILQSKISNDMQQIRILMDTNQCQVECDKRQKLFIFVQNALAERKINLKKNINR